MASDTKSKKTSKMDVTSGKISKLQVPFDTGAGVTPTIPFDTARRSNTTMRSSYFMRSKATRKDPELQVETPNMISVYPFPRVRNDSNPIFSRIRSNIRTKADFDNPHKYKIREQKKDDSGLTLEEQIEIEQNPYKYNKRFRKKTKDSY